MATYAPAPPGRVLSGPTDTEFALPRPDRVAPLKRSISVATRLLDPCANSNTAADVRGGHLAFKGGVTAAKCEKCSVCLAVTVSIGRWASNSRTAASSDSVESEPRPR